MHKLDKLDEITEETRIWQKEWRNQLDTEQ